MKDDFDKKVVDEVSDKFKVIENFSKKLRENSFIGRFSDPKNPVDESPFKE